MHYAAPFKKYYQGGWDQPGIGSASTDFIPEGRYGGGNNVAYNSYIQRYMILNSDSQNYSYANLPTAFIGRTPSSWACWDMYRTSQDTLGPSAREALEGHESCVYT